MPLEDGVWESCLVKLLTRPPTKSLLAFQNNALYYRSVTPVDETGNFIILVWEVLLYK